VHTPDGGDELEHDLLDLRRDERRLRAPGKPGARAAAPSRSCRTAQPDERERIRILGQRRDGQEQGGSEDGRAHPATIARIRVDVSQ
jgi:hypothetical protein